ncbi:transporter [Flavobacterium sp.]|uniref:transporter n=1 Tax=Flavobacterium sp. TaxID=239 RepID=UPI003751DA62
MKLKFLIILIIIFCSQNNYAQHTDVINSNRPGESMSAFAVGKTVVQIESGLSFLNEKHSVLKYKANGTGLDFNLRYGIFKEQLETILEIAYQNDSYVNDLGTLKRTGLRSSTMGVKYLVYDPFKYAVEKVNLYSWKANHKFNWKQLIPAVAVYGGVNLNFSNNPFISKEENLSVISPKFMVISQSHFGNGYVFLVNIFMDKIGTDFQSLEYIITLTKGFNEQWSAFIENKAIKGDYYADVIFRGGAAYLLNKNLQVDASISKNYKGTPAIVYGGVGISWRSDTNHKDVMIKAKKEKKKKDKSKKGKEKAKAKKRLDEIELTKP